MSAPHADDTADAAERVAEFLLAGVQAQCGRMWNGGLRPGREVDARGLPPRSALVTFATQRVRGVSEIVTRGLLAWAREGRPADLLGGIPTAREVLARQARGRRCISLVADEAAAAHGDPRHPDGLRFALHDLEHLEKFVTPEHHRGQVGFFRAVERSLQSQAFAAIEAGFDETWCQDRDYVLADMNGSAVFLFAVLKMKVNMAMRRQHARQVGGPAPGSGPLSAVEHAFAAPAIAAMVAGFGLAPAAHAAALAVSARRDHPDAARCLLAGFEALADAHGELGDSSPVRPSARADLAPTSSLTV